MTAPAPADDPYAPDVPRTAWAQALATLDMLPDVVRLRRQRLGLGLRDCSRQIGISTQGLRGIESGRGVHLNTARLAVAWLDKTEEESSRG